MKPLAYIAGQANCSECGFVELLIRPAALKWERVRRCGQCGSRSTNTPLWWPVEDPKALAAVRSCEIDRATKRFIAQRRMH